MFRRKFFFLDKTKLIVQTVVTVNTMSPLLIDMFLLCNIGNNNLLDNNKKLVKEHTKKSNFSHLKATLQQSNTESFNIVKKKKFKIFFKLIIFITPCIFNCLNVLPIHI